MIIPFQMRLDCKHSYAAEDGSNLHDFNLRCEIGDTICDGTLYECCMWDKGFAERIEQIAFMQVQTPLIQRLMEQEGGQK